MISLSEWLELVSSFSWLARQLTTQRGHACAKSRVETPGIAPKSNNKYRPIVLVCGMVKVVIKKNKHIEIVSSSKSYLSSMSKPSREAILAALSKKYVQVGITLIDTLADLEELVANQPDLVFLGMKFIPSNPELGLGDPNKIWLANYLEDHGIAHTGSSSDAHELELYKALAKQRVQLAGLNTSPYCVIKQGQQCVADDVSLQYPLFLKPTNRGGGMGIDENSIVYNLDQLNKKSKLISDKYKSDTLVERYLPGREFSVAVLKNEHGQEYSVMPMELIASADGQGQRVLSGAAKSANTERAFAVEDDYLKATIGQLAIDVFKAIGARDYGRIDIRLDENGRPQFLEANLIPSLIEDYGTFPKACQESLGLDHQEMLSSIVQLALSRANALDENKEFSPTNNISPRLASI